MNIFSTYKIGSGFHPTDWDFNQTKYKMKSTKQTFSTIEIGSLFRFNCLYWVKTAKEAARSVSDDVFEAGKDPYFPDAGLSFFKPHVQVEPKEKLSRLPNNVEIWQIMKNHNRVEVNLIPPHQK